MIKYVYVQHGSTVYTLAADLLIHPFNFNLVHVDGVKLCILVGGHSEFLRNLTGIWSCS